MFRVKFAADLVQTDFFRTLQAQLAQQSAKLAIALSYT